MQRASLLRCKPPAPDGGDNQPQSHDDSGSFPNLPSTHHHFIDSAEENSTRTSRGQLLRKLRCGASKRGNNSGSQKGAPRPRWIHEDEENDEDDESKSSYHYRQNQQLVDDNMFACQTTQCDERLSSRQHPFGGNEDDSFRGRGNPEPFQLSDSTLKRIEEEPVVDNSNLTGSWLARWENDDDEEDLVLFEHSIGEESSSLRHFMMTRSSLQQADDTKQSKSPDLSEDKTAPMSDEASSGGDKNQNLDSNESEDKLGVESMAAAPSDGATKKHEKIVDFNPVAALDTQYILKDMDNFLKSSRDDSGCRSVPSLMSRIEKLETMLREEEAEGRLLGLEATRSTGAADGPPNTTATGPSVVRGDDKRHEWSSRTRRLPLRTSPTTTGSSVAPSSAAAPSFASLVQRPTCTHEQRLATEGQIDLPISNVTPRPFFWRSHPGVTYTSYGSHQAHRKPVMTSPRRKTALGATQSFAYPAVMRTAHFTEGGTGYDQPCTEAEPALGDWNLEEEERASFLSDPMFQFDTNSSQTAHAFDSENWGGHTFCKV